MTKRTDIHRPSSDDFTPEAYQLVDIFDFGEPLDHAPRIATVARLVENGTPFANHQVSGRCGHCGVAIRYAALMHHVESNEIIWVGETCLGTRFSGTKAKFKAARERAKKQREHNDRLAMFDVNLALAVDHHPSLSILGSYEECEKVSSFLGDVRGRLFRFPLSERQLTVAVQVIEKHAQLQERIAEEKATSIPAPEGRVAVTGEVRAIKVYDNDYSPYGGDVVKMAVRDDRGFTAWLTAPASLISEVPNAFHLKGKRVTFTATLTRSEDDETFAKGKRPSNASILADETVEVAA